MPARHVEIDGQHWRVYPSGFITANTGDEYGILFVRGEGDAATVRVTRYAPLGATSREQSLAQLSDADLQRLFRYSQASEHSPEAGYHP